MSRFLLVLLLLSTARAGGDDAAVAPPLRWADPNGTPAGTRRSACLPIVTDVEEAWSVDLPGLAASPLVYWEREAFVACRKDLGYALVAIDVFTGRITAEIKLPKGTPEPLPVVWNGNVFVRIGACELGEYRRSLRSFQRVWVHKPAEEFLTDPIVFENEIYAVADGNLVRLQPRRKSPLWTAGNGRLRDRPALRGNSVYALQEGESVTIHVFDRRTGERLGSHLAAHYAHGEPAGSGRRTRIAVTSRAIFIRGRSLFLAEPVPASTVMLGYTEIDHTLRFRREPPLLNVLVEPATTPLGPLVLAKFETIGWALLEDERRFRFLTTPKHNPDLFHRAVRVAPTVLGDIAYFGTWAADLRTRHVLWRLPVKELYTPPVPLDRMVIVVESKRRVRAFRPRRSSP